MTKQRLSILNGTVASKLSVIKPFSSNTTFDVIILQMDTPMVFDMHQGEMCHGKEEMEQKLSTSNSNASVCQVNHLTADDVHIHLLIYKEPWVFPVVFVI